MNEKKHTQNKITHKHVCWSESQIIALSIWIHTNKIVDTATKTTTTTTIKITERQQQQQQAHIVSECKQWIKTRDRSIDWSLACLQTHNARGPKNSYYRKVAITKHANPINCKSLAYYYTIFFLRRTLYVFIYILCSYFIYLYTFYD